MEKGRAFPASNRMFGDHLQEADVLSFTRYSRRNLQVKGIGKAEPALGRIELNEITDEL